MKSLLALNKSFAPILLVLVALYLLLLNVHFKALSSADKITVIQIQAAQADTITTEEEQDSEGELDAYLDETYLEGANLLSLKNYDEVDKIIDVLKNSGKAQLSDLLKGRLAMIENRDAQALELFNQIIQRGEASVSTYFFRARLNSRLDQPEKDIQDYDRVLQTNSHHFSAHYNRGLLLYDVDEY